MSMDAKLMDEQEKQLSQEFNYWSFLKFVAPSIFVFVFIAVYQIVDGIFIERFVGEMAISAVNLYYPIISLYIAVGIMLGTGGNALIVKKVGEGKKKEAGQTFSRLLVFTVLIGILFTAVCLIFADPIMRLCGATEGNINYLRPYYYTLSSFSLAILLQSELGILIIGEGKTTNAAIAIIIGGILNCVLDYFFMKTMHMGIKGAAVATVIGYASTIVYAIWFYGLAKKSSYRLEIAKPDLKEIGQMCLNGSSDMVSNLAGGVTVLFMNHLAFKCYGEVGVSALSVVTYVEFLISAVFMGLTSAVEPVFSYHYGSGNTQIRKKIFKISMVWSVLLGIVSIVILFAFRKQAIGVFFREGTEFFDIASVGYLISLPAALFVGINIFVSGLFTAFGNGLVSGILSAIRSFVILTACIFILTALFSGNGLWASWPAAEVLSLIPGFIALGKYRERYQYM